MKSESEMTLLQVREAEGRRAEEQLAQTAPEVPAPPHSKISSPVQNVLFLLSFHPLQPQAPLSSGSAAASTTRRAAAPSRRAAAGEGRHGGSDEEAAGTSHFLNFSNVNSWLQEEMKFKMELCEQQMEEVRGRREVEITQLDGKLQVWVFKAGAKADI